MAPYRTLVLSLLAAAMLSGGCVYRPDIQQGNLLTVEDIEQVTVGMTRSQVRFLLGTPMVSDPFAPHRWDYVYRMVYGRNRSVDSAHFVVFFEGDKVVRVETLAKPSHTRQTATNEKQLKKKQKEDAAAAQGKTAPDINPQLPGAPEPGT